MKGAIGNAFILNIVITLVIIFFTLLIGSMAYTKAYKTKNHLITSIEKYNSENKLGMANIKLYGGMDKWKEIVDPYLGKVGYSLSTKEKTCPNKEELGYEVLKDTSIGDYEYCIYKKTKQKTGIINHIDQYMVLVYMKLELPVIGDRIKLPITSETKTYTYYN